MGGLMESQLTGQGGSSRPLRAFVTGVTGQDGYYLARALLARGFHVTAGVRLVDGVASSQVADELPGLELIHFDLNDPASILSSIQNSQPDQVYHLAGISNVGETWRQPAKAVRINIEGTVHLLEAVRHTTPKASLVFAGSGDCFDHDAAGPRGLLPTTPLRCTNPYAISKAAAMQFVQRYREIYGLRGSVAIFLNHTSPRRPRPFVERRIVHEAVRVSRGLADKITLGSLATVRDWSWCEDLMQGVIALGARQTPGDYVFASGKVHTTGDWVNRAFARLGLDIGKHLHLDPSQLHSGDRPHTFGNIEPAKRDLGWSPKTSFEEIVDRMINAELASVE